MHPAFNHLAKRVGETEQVLAKLIREVQQQNERETKLLEQAAYGREFDEEVAPVQEKVVAAFQAVLESLDRALDELEASQARLKEISEE